VAAQPVTGRLGRRLARAALATCAIAAVAHAETRPSYGGDVVASLLGEPATLDPVAARSVSEITLTGLVFDNLYRMAPDGTIAPHLALALPEVSGSTARIALRTVETHAGGTLGPADVVASLERLRGSKAGWILAGVGAAAIDGDTVVLPLDHAMPELAARLALPQAAITPGGSAVGATGVIGSGPFSVVQVDRKKRKVVLRAFDNHFAGRPYVDELELSWFVAADAEVRRFETGGAHLSLRGATTFTGHQPKYKNGDVEGPDSLLVFVGFGSAHPAVTGNRDLRKALSLALPRGGFSTIGSGEHVTLAGGPLPIDFGGVDASATVRAGDLDAAESALRAAAAKVPELAAAKIGSLSLEILVDASHPDDGEVAERVVRALDKLGIASKITSLGAVELADRVAAGKCDLWVGQLPAVASDPALLWASAFAAGGDGWAKGQLAKGAIDPAGAAKEFAARLPILPLYHRSIRVSHRTDLRDLTVDACGRVGLADAFFFGGPERAK
jgi:ABC-type transport system substrate-binding protein